MQTCLSIFQVREQQNYLYVLSISRYVRRIQSCPHAFVQVSSSHLEIISLGCVLGVSETVSKGRRHIHKISVSQRQRVRGEYDSTDR